MYKIVSKKLEMYLGNCISNVFLHIVIMTLDYPSRTVLVCMQGSSESVFMIGKTDVMTCFLCLHVTPCSKCESNFSGKLMLFSFMGVQWTTTNEDMRQQQDLRQVYMPPRINMSDKDRLYDMPSVL